MAEKEIGGIGFFSMLHFIGLIPERREVEEEVTIVEERFADNFWRSKFVDLLMLQKNLRQQKVN